MLQSPLPPISEKPVQNREATQKRLEAICQQFNVPGLIVGSFDVNGELSLYSSGIRRMDHEEKITIDDPMHSRFVHQGDDRYALGNADR